MRFVVLGLALWVTPGLANDGFGGLSATGLTFGQTEAVAMESEDLTISPDRITVAYIFRNITDADVTGEVIFPLPPIPLAAQLESAWNLPADKGRDNLMDFTATVDGRSVPVTIDRIAVIEPPWQEGRAPSAQYDTPGTDVTAALARHGISLSIDAEAVRAQLMAMPEAQRATMKAEALADWYVPTAEEAASGLRAEAWPLWSVVQRHHWTQTFAAGATVRIEHSYANHPPGGLFYWQDPPQEEWYQALRERYCIDAGTSRAIMQVLPKDPDDGQGFGTAWDIEYVLRTANSWAGPIKHFRLTLDKGAKDRVISLCATGLVKTGPTTFVMEKTDFVPDRDLEIILIGKSPD